jgi:hypothetical protein
VANVAADFLHDPWKVRCSTARAASQPAMSLYATLTWAPAQVTIGALGLKANHAIEQIVEVVQEYDKARHSFMVGWPCS